MGTFNTTCALTRLPIEEGDDVYGFFLVKNDQSRIPKTQYQPIRLPLAGRYNGDGDITPFDTNDDVLLKRLISYRYYTTVDDPSFPDDHTALHSSTFHQPVGRCFILKDVADTMMESISLDAEGCYTLPETLRIAENTVGRLTASISRDNKGLLEYLDSDEFQYFTKDIFELRIPYDSVEKILLFRYFSDGKYEESKTLIRHIMLFEFIDMIMDMSRNSWTIDINEGNEDRHIDLNLTLNRIISEKLKQY